MRSLLLTTSFPPALGGVETLLYQVARRLDSPPLVLAPTRAAAPDVPVWPVRTTPLSIAGRAAYHAQWRIHPSFHYLFTFWRPAFAAARYERPDVIQCGHLLLAPLAWLLARRLQVPFALYGYGQEIPFARRQGIAPIDRIMRGTAIRAADVLFCTGSFGAGLLRAWGARPERIVPVPFGAEPRPPAPAPSGYRLLSVARLVPRKGIDTAIQAVARLASTFPSLQYRIVGSGPDELTLRDRAVRAGVANRIIFDGPLPAAALEDAYRACSLFLLPTRRTSDGEFEGFGLVLLEAAAWGRPVVAGTTGGERDAVVHGETGLLVDGASVDQVADAVARLLGDPARLQRMGAAGRARVESTFNWQNAASVVQSALEKSVQQLCSRR